MGILIRNSAGSHYNSEFSNNIPIGKMWGPWLFYVNNGDLWDAESRSKKENLSWPYRWLDDTDYQNRGSVTGKLILSDGRPATGAAIFLGDENGLETNNQGTFYQYTTYAADDGSFTLKNVRREKSYRLIAWANGGALSDVDGVHNGTTVSFNKTCSVDLGTVVWSVPNRDIEWQIGDFDRKTLGFKYGGAVMERK